MEPEVKEESEVKDPPTKSEYKKALDRVASSPLAKFVVLEKKEFPAKRDDFVP